MDCGASGTYEEPANGNHTGKYTFQDEDPPRAKINRLIPRRRARKITDLHPA